MRYHRYSQGKHRICFQATFLHRTHWPAGLHRLQRTGSPSTARFQSRSCSRRPYRTPPRIAEPCRLDLSKPLPVWYSHHRNWTRGRGALIPKSIARRQKYRVVWRGSIGGTGELAGEKQTQNRDTFEGYCFRRRYAAGGTACDCQLYRRSSTSVFSICDKRSRAKRRSRWFDQPHTM